MWEIYVHIPFPKKCEKKLETKCRGISRFLCLVSEKFFIFNQKKQPNGKKLTKTFLPKNLGLQIHPVDASSIPGGIRRNLPVKNHPYGNPNGAGNKLVPVP